MDNIFCLVREQTWIGMNGDIIMKKENLGSNDATHSILDTFGHYIDFDYTKFVRDSVLHNYNLFLSHTSSINNIFNKIDTACNVK